MEKNLDEEQYKNTGFEEFNTRYDTVEEEIVREVFGGVQFESGLPSKVYERTFNIRFSSEEAGRTVKSYS